MNLFALARAGYGLVMLAAPDQLIGLYAGHRPTAAARRVARLLGARQLIQALVCAGRPGGAVLLLGAEVDLAHAASGLGLAAADRFWRRAGLTDAVVAAGYAAAGAALAHRASSVTVISRPHPAAQCQPGRLAAGRERLAARLSRLVVPAPACRWVSGAPAGLGQASLGQAGLGQAGISR